MGINTRLREQRKELGYTQRALADACGVSEITQRNYEAGRSCPDARYLSAAIDLLDVDYILRNNPTNKNSKDSIASRLKSERRKVGLTQVDLANLGGVGLSTQKNYESITTDNVPDADYLSSVSAVLDIGYILTGETTLTSAAYTAQATEEQIINALYKLSVDISQAIKGNTKQTALNKAGA